jgi:hypothetical protein
MTRHSKNNNALAVFTYQEKLKLKNVYGTLETRVGRDSMKPVDSCSLCIAKARNPVCCDKGHVYCKECILDSILQQKKVLQEEKEKVEKHNLAVITPEQKAEMEERERNLNKFLQGNSVISKSSDVGPNTKATGIFDVIFSVLAARSDPICRSIEIKRKSWGYSLLCWEDSSLYQVRVSIYYSLKKLATIKFNEKEDVNCCPVCLKTFNLGAIVKVIKSCG